MSEPRNSSKEDKLRYMVYRYVINKVIGRATAYKRLLLTIKGEYDDVIGALQRRENSGGHNVTPKITDDLPETRRTPEGQKNPGVADLCLALATTVYEACRLDRKTALSLCRRGFIHSAAEFMNHCCDLTAEDCMLVMCPSPSLSLLQLLTAPQQGRAAILSLGVACSTLLSDPQQQQLALQLLDSVVSKGRGVVEEAILQDSRLFSGRLGALLTEHVFL
ncbi:hypothetical protein VZT92_001327 [Zoarces viviparus]|uniref:Translin-associated factor X-interacting protein 1 N-terminal domain-containing protein n=1 Tax=Zoarces viviparus TaxID=48416 RepID=A0AAW1G473_ZOAVI